MNAVIEIKNLHKNYGDTPALIGVDLDIEAGVFGLLGPNGAGKTTLLKLLLGLMKPDQGKVKIFGYDSYSQSFKIREIMGYLGEDQRFYEYMKGEEYLEFIGLVKRLTKEEARAQSEDILKSVSLFEYRGRKIKRYSQGMKRRLGLASTLVGDPKIVILDEPTSNMDPISRQVFLDIVRELGENGTTVILSSHVLGEVEQVCSSIALFNQGQVAYHGRLSDLKEKFPDQSLQEIFVEMIAGDKDE
ncbi:MAG: ABC transporter ATP-binding protein [Halobacteriota archaeon]|nr:ABC transporter ATP-binding protein [Halobacteriota archaeon]